MALTRRRKASGAILLLSILNLVAVLRSVSAFRPPLATRKRYRQTSLTTSYAVAPTKVTSTLTVGDLVGNGSYGTVHLCNLVNDDDGDRSNKQQEVVCKRAWNKADLEQRNVESPEKRQQRCQYYFEVEKHCFEKMEAHPQLPEYCGTFADESGCSWMTFSVLRDQNALKPAPSLSDVIQLEWQDQHAPSNSPHHHLWMVQKALGLSDELSFAGTLDAVIESLLQVLAHTHAQGIVHRDVKPANLLCDSRTQSLVLIDFGSAADMDPIKSNKFWGGKKRVGLEDEGRVAVSPIYAAPETFIRHDRAPFQFDVFSAALIICQLIFNFLDERMDAGFHQQVEDANCDLDAWLSRELSSKVRPSGLQEALEYFGERPGLWKLLSEMLRKDPEQRIASNAALTRFRQIRQGEELADGPFFASVMEIMQTCEIPSEGPAMGPRPLHYVATFRRALPLGLILAEADQEFEDLRWKEATQNAQSGDVFVQEIVSDSQAAKMGIFEIGDRLQGIGELPLASSGFEKVLEMLEKQPASAKYVKLHFDRRSIREAPKALEETTKSYARVVEQGAWSVKGRRKAQEDAFILQEMHDEKEVLLAAVFDGHGGTAASHAAQQLMPFLAMEEFRRQENVAQALQAAWDATCTTYRDGCELDECTADYDEMEGALTASTGSTSLVAGTTATVVALEEGKVSVLNCGDSRTLLVNSEGSVVFATRDHSPEVEIERFERGQDQGYSMPACSLSRWFLPVGDYEYAVSRSLEGPFATSMGIISDPDVTTVSTENGVIVLASDGLFEVMDNDEVGRDVTYFRSSGLSADEAARELCSMALEKGTSDNVSAIVIYLS